MYHVLVILALCGVLIGVLSGLLGIGGGMLIIPLLRLGVGMDALACVGTSLFTIIPTSLAGVVGHIRNHTSNIKLGLCVGLLGALASPLGSMASKAAGGTVVMVCAGAVIVYTAYTMFRKALRMTSQHAATVDASAAFEPTPIVFDAKGIGKAAAIGLTAGFASGFLGVGGGFIIVPLSIWLYGISMKEAAGTSLVSVVLFAIPGAVAHGMMGDIAFLYGLVIAAGSIPGAFLGSWLCKIVPERTLRFVFAIMLLVVGVVLVANEFGWLG